MLLYFAVIAVFNLLIYKYLHTLLMKLGKMTSVMWTNNYFVIYYIYEYKRK